MHTYPVWDLFESVGEVTLTVQGLYLCYDAKVQTEKPGFLRLYHHKNASVFRLGLFSEESGILTCRGRVSLRSMEKGWEDGCFSLREEPLCLLTSPLDGGYFPQDALEYWKSGRRFVAIRHENSLPEEMLPYFCFLVPEKIDGISCLTLEVDAEGKPVIP